MSLQNWILGVAIVVVGFVAFYGVSHPKAVIDATKVDVNAIAQAVLNKVQPQVDKFGASAGPDRFNDCESMNGITQCFTRMAIKTATNTPCVIKSPTATSTILRTALKITTGSSTATVWNVSKGTNAFQATTTKLDVFALGSGAQGAMSFMASSTVSAAVGGKDPDGAMVFPPNTYVAWSLLGTAYAQTDRMLGVCQATFEVI